MKAAEGRALPPMLRLAVRELSRWDYQASTDSAAMCIYFFSWRRLTEKLLVHRLGSRLFRQYIYGWTSPSLAVENLLEKKDPYWLPPGYDSYESLVLDSLGEAVEELEAIFGNREVGTWKWGKVHHLTCRHLLELVCLSTGF